MTPKQLHWVYEARKPQRMFGSMSEDEIREQYRLTYGDD
jgi:hypothetical protein